MRDNWLYLRERVELGFVALYPTHRLGAETEPLRSRGAERTGEGTSPLRGNRERDLFGRLNVTHQDAKAGGQCPPYIKLIVLPPESG